MKSYVIHLESAVERKPYIEKIQSILPTEIFPAFFTPENGHLGCTASHLELYKRHPNDGLLVWEDDCEILRDDILDVVNRYKSDHDIVYLGVNSKFKETPKSPEFSYGTHAMWLSPTAREKIQAMRHLVKTKEIDHLWNQTQQKFKLRAWRPDPIDMYCRQAPRLLSYITNKTRE